LQGIFYQFYFFVVYGKKPYKSIKFFHKTTKNIPKKYVNSQIG